MTLRNFIVAVLASVLIGSSDGANTRSGHRSITLRGTDESRHPLASRRLAKTDEYIVPVFLEFQFVSDFVAVEIEAKDTKSSLVFHICDSIEQQATGSIVQKVASKEAKATIETSGKDLGCRISDTSRLYDEEAVDLLGPNYFTLQIAAYQLVQATSNSRLTLEEVSEIVASGFDVARGGHEEFLALIQQHPLLKTVMSIELIDALSPPDEFPVSTVAPTTAAPTTVAPTTLPTAAPSLLPDSNPPKAPHGKPSGKVSSAPSPQPGAVETSLPAAAAPPSSSSNEGSFLIPDVEGDTHEKRDHDDSDHSTTTSDSSLADNRGSDEKESNPAFIAVAIGLGVVSAIMLVQCVRRRRRKALKMRESSQKKGSVRKDFLTDSISGTEEFKIDEVRLSDDNQSLAETSLGDHTAGLNRPQVMLDQWHNLINDAKTPAPGGDDYSVGMLDGQTVHSVMSSASTDDANYGQLAPTEGDIENRFHMTTATMSAYGEGSLLSNIGGGSQAEEQDSMYCETNSERLHGLNRGSPVFFDAEEASPSKANGGVSLGPEDEYNDTETGSGRNDDQHCPLVNHANETGTREGGVACKAHSFSSKTTTPPPFVPRSFGSSATDAIVHPVTPDGSGVAHQRTLSDIAQGSPDRGRGLSIFTRGRESSPARRSLGLLKNQSSPLIESRPSSTPPEGLRLTYSYPDDECGATVTKDTPQASMSIGLQEGQVNGANAATGDNIVANGSHMQVSPIRRPDTRSSSSLSSGASPDPWLNKSISKTLDSPSATPDIASLPQSSRLSSLSLNSGWLDESQLNRNEIKYGSEISCGTGLTGSENSYSSNSAGHAIRQLNLKPAAIDADERTASTATASSANTSMTSFRSQVRGSPKRRKRRVVVDAPPGALGVILANSHNGKGTTVSEIRKVSPLKGKMHRGDLLIAVDEEDVTQMDMDQITAFIASRGESRRQFTVIRSAMASQGVSNNGRSPKARALSRVATS